MPLYIVITQAGILNGGVKANRLDDVPFGLLRRSKDLRADRLSGLSARKRLHGREGFGNRRAHASDPNWSRARIQTRIGEAPLGAVPAGDGRTGQSDRYRDSGGAPQVRRWRWDRSCRRSQNNSARWAISCRRGAARVAEHVPRISGEQQAVADLHLQRPTAGRILPHPVTFPLPRIRTSNCSVET